MIPYPDFISNVDYNIPDESTLNPPYKDDVEENEENP